MMNQPVNVIEYNQQCLEIGLYLLHLPQSFALGGHLLCFGVISVHRGFITGDYQGHEVHFWLAHNGQCKWTTCDHPSVSLLEDSTQVLLTPAQFANC